MGKKKKSQNRELSQAEIWDDSALIRSWDEAVEEYKLYHSIHARGENVEDVLREADSEGSAVNESSRKLHDSDLPTSNGLDQVMDEDLEDGEVPSENSRVRSQAATDAVGPQGPEASSSTQPPSEPQISHDAGTNGRGPLNTPLDHMLRRVQDESLKNLMMAWYYAGYYTGLHEGQQLSNQAQAKPS